MSKFLNIVENNLPSQDLDSNRAVIQELQQLLRSKGIISVPKTFRDIITITVGNKKVDLELKGVTDSAEEDGEDDVIAGLLNTNDDHLKNNALALGAKKKLTNAVVKVANDVSTAVSKNTSINSTY